MGLDHAVLRRQGAPYAISRWGGSVRSAERRFLIVLSINYAGNGLRDALDARKVL